jgi:hypothetical protein
MIILSGLFAAGWRASAGVGGWKVKNLEKRGGSMEQRKSQSPGTPGEEKPTLSKESVEAGSFGA